VVSGGFKKNEGGWRGRFMCIIVDLNAPQLLLEFACASFPDFLDKRPKLT
jgi:hypothetical protein